MADPPDMPDRSERGGLARYQQRYGWAVGFVVVVFAIFLGRIWYLQVIRGAHYHRASTENIVRTVKLDPPRGRIFDRHGIPVATNRSSHAVRLIPRILRGHDVDKTLGRLQRYLNLTDDRVETLVERVEKENAPILVAEDISRRKLARIETDKMRLPGVEIRVDSRRYYPLNSVLAHTVGFMGELGADELQKWRKYGYRGGDYVGQMGLERAFEGTLRGSPGQLRQVVNAKGIPQRSSSAAELLGGRRRIAPIPGRDLVLTIDAELQLIAARAMESYPSGAVVAVDPRNGDVLAMYSKPTFNPNSWSGELSKREKMRIDNDPFKPMLDKTVRPYFPGSVFKITPSYAGLDTGVVDVGEEKKCPGYYFFGGRMFRCWNLAGHGEVDLTEALKHSCDVFFYKLATDLGIDRIAEYAYKFGFGERTGLPHNQERSGLVPTKKWHREHSPNGYQQGFALNLVLGQGNAMATPIQVALAYAAIANGGSLYYPRIVEEIRNGDGDELFHFPSKVRKEVGMTDGQLATIRKGLRKAVNQEGGTAYRVHRDDLSVSGKTGTAQVHSMSRVRVPNRDKLFQLRDHAWFAAYAPSEDPTVALAVFLEHAGHGGRRAAPVAMEIFDRYFESHNDDSLRKKISRKLRRNRIEP